METFFRFFSFPLQNPTVVLLPGYSQAKCEAILRSMPDNRNAAELHLAAIEAAEEQVEERVKKAAIGGTTAVAAIGLVVGVVGMLMKKR